jgi:hypothetical protein
MAVHPSHVMRRRACRLLAGLVASVPLVIGSSLPAHASDATLRATLNTWSRTIAADAQSVTLAAQRHHPRRVMFSARRFRTDSQHARAAIVRQRASSAKGRNAKKLALKAYTSYGRAGTGWTASGRARLARHIPAAKRAALAAAASARAGNRLLVSAGKLLR